MSDRERGGLDQNTTGSDRLTGRRGRWFGVDQRPGRAELSQTMDVPIPDHGFVVTAGPPDGASIKVDTRGIERVYLDGVEQIRETLERSADTTRATKKGVRDDLQSFEPVAQGRKILETLHCLGRVGRVVEKKPVFASIERSIPGVNTTRRGWTDRPTVYPDREGWGGYSRCTTCLRTSVRQRGVGPRGWTTGGRPRRRSVSRDKGSPSYSSVWIWRRRLDRLCKHQIHDKDGAEDACGIREQTGWNGMPGLTDSDRTIVDGKGIKGGFGAALERTHHVADE